MTGLEQPTALPDGVSLGGFLGLIEISRFIPQALLQQLEFSRGFEALLSLP